MQDILLSTCRVFLEVVPSGAVTYTHMSVNIGATKDLRTLFCIGLENSIILHARRPSKTSTSLLSPAACARKSTLSFTSNFLMKLVLAERIHCDSKTTPPFCSMLFAIAYKPYSSFTFSYSIYITLNCVIKTRTGVELPRRNGIGVSYSHSRMIENQTLS